MQLGTLRPTYQCRTSRSETGTDSSTRGLAPVRIWTKSRQRRSALLSTNQATSSA